MVAQDVKSTTGRHSKRLFINRSITVELKKMLGFRQCLLEEITGQTPGPQKSSQANLFHYVFRMLPQN
jgi:hypothetical protein